MLKKKEDLKEKEDNKDHRRGQHGVLFQAEISIFIQTVGLRLLSLRTASVKLAASTPVPPAASTETQGMSSLTWSGQCHTDDQQWVHEFSLKSENSSGAAVFNSPVVKVSKDSLPELPLPVDNYDIQCKTHLPPYKPVSDMNLNCNKVRQKQYLYLVYMRLLTT